MKIRDAKQMYAAHRSGLWEKRQSLSKVLKEQGSSLAAFDRVEISRELSAVDAQYDAVDKALAGIVATETQIFGDECNRRQSETLAKAAEEEAKIMEVYRRIASGAKVPAKDQQKLMDYDMKLYAAARQAALIAQQNDKEYDSLWEDQEKAGERKDPGEIVGDTDITVSHPSVVAASASVSAEEAP